MSELEFEALEAQRKNAFSSISLNLPGTSKRPRGSVFFGKSSDEADIASSRTLKVPGLNPAARRSSMSIVSDTHQSLAEFQAAMGWVLPTVTQLCVMLFCFGFSSFTHRIPLFGPALCSIVSAKPADDKDKEEEEADAKAKDGDGSDEEEEDTSGPQENAEDDLYNGSLRTRELAYPEFLELLAALAVQKHPDPFERLPDKLELFLNEDVVPTAKKAGVVL